MLVIKNSPICYFPFILTLEVEILKKIQSATQWGAMRYHMDLILYRGLGVGHFKSINICNIIPTT